MPLFYRADNPINRSLIHSFPHPFNFVASLSSIPFRETEALPNHNALLFPRRAGPAAQVTQRRSGLLRRLLPRRHSAQPPAHLVGLTTLKTIFKSVRPCYWACGHR